MVDKRPNVAAMWDERFSRTELVYGDEPNAYLREQAQKRLKAGAKVLVPGDGYGRNGLWLAKQGCELTTIDVSPVGVERARNDAKRAGLALQILLGDVNTWDWPKSEFDAIVSIYLHLPPEQRSGVHRQMFEALRPGGIVILEAFTPAQLQFSSGGPKQVELLYNTEILRQDFAAAEVLELAELEVELHEGKMHLGEGAVVRAVLRKK
ncbi:MAG TPA: class I SAM-dependent methyltransferase [Candidatus Acidoferrum sp.]|nr:class I SAM-dependent methyltransferase [Candidatus Acidoferrum sp.]